jgi:FixJ family two-component response regulator
MIALTGASEMIDTDSGGAANYDAIVFVVDDDASVRRSTERLVCPLGFGIQTFASAREFLDNARVERPACLVLDVQMPGLSGLELQRELDQRGIEIPIIFVTGHGDIPTTVRAMKAGAVEFLTKPVKSRDLLVAIRAAIERGRVSYRAQREVAALRERYERLTPREREVLPLPRACSTSRPPASSLPRSGRSSSTARTSCRTWKRSRSRTSCAWRSGSTSGRLAGASLSPRTGRTLHQEPASDSFRARLL